MNKAQTLTQRNDNARLVRHANRSGSHRNCVRISAANTLAHEIMKLRVAYELIKEGHEVLTEAIFDTGGRADVLCLDTGTCYEIVHSENGVKLNGKAGKYPESLEIVAVCSITGDRKLVRRSLR